MLGNIRIYSINESDSAAIWGYSINKGDAGGVVVAKTKEEAKQKIKEMYAKYEDSEYTADEITVWKAR